MVKEIWLSILPNLNKEAKETLALTVRISSQSFDRSIQCTKPNEIQEPIKIDLFGRDLKKVPNFVIEFFLDSTWLKRSQ